MLHASVYNCTSSQEPYQNGGNSHHYEKFIFACMFALLRAQYKEIIFYLFSD